VVLRRGFETELSEHLADVTLDGLELEREPLRDRGVLLIGSGGIVHNLRVARLDRKDAPVDGWAMQFDDWVRDRVEQRDVAELAAYRDGAPGASMAVAESEHLDPLFFALGAARPDDRLLEVNRGFEYGNLSLASYAFVPAEEQ